MYGEYHQSNMETLVMSKKSLRADTLATLSVAIIIAIGAAALFIGREQNTENQFGDEYVTQRPPPVDAVQQIKDGEYQFYTLDPDTLEPVN